MELGREELLMKEADVLKEIVVKSNNKDRVGLTSVELSYLHQQLQGITTTCTLIIGFAMAALSADLLTQLGDDTGQFCLYKSPTATILSGLFILLTTTCICSCFTIIACVQIIIFQSQRAIFSRSMVHRCGLMIERTRPRRQVKRVNLTPRVVRMTQLLMYGDRSANWSDRSDHQAGAADRVPSASSRSESALSTPRRAGFALGGFSIYLGMAVALSTFFASVVILIWLFLSPLADWRHMPTTSTAAVRNGLVNTGGLGAAANSSNPALVQSYGGQWKARCLDPYDDADAQHRATTGIVLSTVCSVVFALNVLLGWRIGHAAIERYSLASLLELPEEELELLDQAHGEVAIQDLEDWDAESFVGNDGRTSTTSNGVPAGPRMVPDGTFSNPTQAV